MKLFDGDAVTFICNLDNCIECLVTEEENGLFEVDFTYNIASSEFNEIKNDRVVEVKASDELGLQLFRIYHMANEINGNVYVKAQHISYDLIDNFVEGVTCTNSTCEQSFNEMLSKCEVAHKFKGYSDIEHVATYNVNRVNALQAIAGTRGSLLDTYGNGAKLKRDNYNIYLNKTRGKNNGVRIAYSKNILGYKREIDESEVVTCIYPFAKIQNEFEGSEGVEETIVLPERFVNSKYINNFPHPKILAVDYSEREVKTIEHLRKEANKYFAETRKDIPSVNYQVEFVYLHQTLEYQSLNLKELELVGMGDTVIVEDYRIGMNVESKVIKTVFNVLTDRYDSIELGRFKGSIDDILGDLESSVDNALTQVKNMYVNFEVLDDKIISEVSRLDGDIKTHTTLIQQTADSITQVAKDVEGNTSLIQQTSSEIKNKVSNGEFESYKTQTAELIASKVGSDNIGTLIEQSPTSVKIGFNKINDSVSIEENKMQFKDSAGNQSLSFMRGSLYAYEPNSSVFMGAGVIPRWNQGSFNAGFGVLASANSYYYSISRAGNWQNDTQADAGGITEYLTVNYRDRSDAQKQGVYTYYKLYTSGGINGLGYDIENFKNVKCLDVYAGTWRHTDGTTIITCNGSSISSNKSWNFNSYTLSNLYLSNATINSSPSVKTNVVKCDTYQDSSNSEIFQTWGNGGNMNNKRNWDWGRKNLFNANMGYAIPPTIRDYKEINLDGVLDSINIYPCATTFDTENDRSLEIDVTELRQNDNSDLFIKQHETINEDGNTEIVENIDMKSMLHLALLEIKNLKEEVRILKESRCINE